MLANIILYISWFYFEGYNLDKNKNISEILVNIMALLIIMDIDEFFDQIMSLYIYVADLDLDSPGDRKVTFKIDKVQASIAAKWVIFILIRRIVIR